MKCKENWRFDGTNELPRNAWIIWFCFYYESLPTISFQLHFSFLFSTLYTAIDISSALNALKWGQRVAFIAETNRFGHFSSFASRTSRKFKVSVWPGFSLTLHFRLSETQRQDKPFNFQLSCSSVNKRSCMLAPSPFRKHFLPNLINGSRSLNDSQWQLLSITNFMHMQSYHWFTMMNHSNIDWVKKKVSFSVATNWCWRI